jgi:hypothetical protein
MTIHSMKTITADGLLSFVKNALSSQGAQDSFSQRLTMQIMYKCAVWPIEHNAQEGQSIEIAIISSRSKQAIRTSGSHVNVFALSSAILTATSAPLSTMSSVAVLLAVIGACTVSLTPEQAAFFIASENIKLSNRTPTAVAMCREIGQLIGDTTYDLQKLLLLINQLRTLHVPVTLGAEPNFIVRHSEWTIPLPGF